MNLEERNDELREPAGKFKRRSHKLSVSRVVVVAKTMTKKKPKMKSCLLYSHYKLGRCHIVFAFFIPLLMGLLQVEYQRKNVSPFDTYPINMWVFFAATCIYCLGLSIQIQLQNLQSNDSQIIIIMISHIILCSGALSSMALASVFLPRLLGWLCLCSWIFFPVMLLRQFIYQIHEWLKHFTSLACKRFNTFWGCLSKKEHLPM